MQLHASCLPAFLEVATYVEYRQLQVQPLEASENKSGGGYLLTRGLSKEVAGEDVEMCPISGFDLDSSFLQHLDFSFLQHLESSFLQHLESSFLHHLDSSFL